MWNDIEEFEWLSLDDLLRKSENPEKPQQPKQPKQPDHVANYMGRMNKVLDGMKHDEKIQTLNNAHNHVQSGVEAGHYTQEQAEQLHDAIHSARTKLMQEQQQPKTRTSPFLTGGSTLQHTVPVGNHPVMHNGEEVKPVVHVNESDSSQDEPKKKWKGANSELHVEEHTVGPHLPPDQWDEGYDEGDQGETPGSKSKFGYSKKLTQHPLLDEDGNEKAYKDITFEDLAAMLHSHRYIHPTQWKKLSKEEQKEHLENGNPLKHLLERDNREFLEDGSPNPKFGRYKYENGKTKLDNMLRTLGWPMYVRAIKNMGLTSLGIDPEDQTDPMFSDYVDSLIHNLYPKERLDNTWRYFGTHHRGYDKFYEKLKWLQSQGHKAGKVNYGGGIDYSRSNTGPNFVGSVKNMTRGGRTQGWAERFLEYGAKTPFGRGFSRVLRDADIKKEWTARRALNERKAELAEMAKKTGLKGEGLSYVPKDEVSLDNLENIAKEAGLDVETDIDTGAKTFVDPNGNEVFSWDKNKKIADLRDALAAHINPKAAEAGSPIANYNNLREQLDNLEAERTNLQNRYEAAVEKYRNYESEPDDHVEAATKFGQIAMSNAQNIASQIQEPAVANTVKDAGQAIAQAMQVLPEMGKGHKANKEELANAVEGLNAALAHIQSIKKPDNSEAMDMWSKSIEHLKTELKRYYSTMHLMSTNPNYANDKDKATDEWYDAKQALEEFDEKAAPARQQMEQLQQTNPEIKAFAEKQQEVKEHEAALKVAEERAKERWKAYRAMLGSMDDLNVGGGNPKSDSEQQEQSQLSVEAIKKLEQEKAAQNALRKYFKDEGEEFDEGQAGVKFDNPDEDKDKEDVSVPHDVDLDIYKIDPETGAYITRERHGVERPVVDREKERKVIEAAERMMNAHQDLKTKTSHAHEFIFGGENAKKGLIHIADHMMNRIVETGEGQDILRELMEEFPENGKTPPPFLSQGEVSKSGRWKLMHRMANIGPNRLVKYALLCSNYSPNPLAPDDFYPGLDHLKHEPGEKRKKAKKEEVDKLAHEEYPPIDPEKEHEVAELLTFVRQATPENWNEDGSPKHVDEDGDPDWGKMKAYNYHNFRQQVYNMLNKLGNYMVESLSASKGQYRDVFEMMKLLNAPHPIFAPKKAEKVANKEDSGDTPGTLRRNLKRNMDVFYADWQHTTPPWNHAHPNPKEWLRNVKGDKVWTNYDGSDMDDREKLIDQLWNDEAKKSLRLFVPADYYPGQQLVKAVRLVIFE